ncbi:neuroglian-like isoform X2 [Antedon mediterranea]|uniref:neuroglian-like isoform X2 n=1 Tax=Antedon mediterranea TaxID=105859 RepID=UPI003AF96F58
MNYSTIMKALSLILFAVFVLQDTDGSVHVTPVGNFATRKVGEDFKAFCGFTDGTQRPKWQYDGEDIPEGVANSNLTLVQLEITSVQFGNQGNYSCSNDDGNDFIHLYVYQEPEFNGLRTNQTLTVGGQNERIACQVTSVNETKYEWRKNKNVISESNDKFRIQKGEYLEIKEVDESDRGVYECVADVYIRNSNQVTVDFKTRRRNIQVNVVGVPVTSGTMKPTEPMKYTEDNSGAQDCRPFKVILLSAIVGLIVAL